MSGKPWPGGASKVIALLDTLAERNTEEAELIKAEERAKVVRSARAAAHRELSKLLRDMDLKEPGNWGYEERFGWFLAEMRRQVTATPKETAAKIAALEADKDRLSDQVCERYALAGLDGVEFWTKNGARIVSLIRDENKGLKARDAAIEAELVTAKKRIEELEREATVLKHEATRLETVAGDAACAALEKAAEAFDVLPEYMEKWKDVARRLRMQKLAVK